ncbi:MAG TPA: carboxypeptidase M32 [Verrucomicrobiae bacterium]|jgi:carboxypeptidase Taq|nr:carboxypeptidase M32 [Verrucomicrobiae bacterium]
MANQAEAPAAYKKLLDRARKIALASSAAQALTWDQETYMPAQALPFRAEQLAWLTGHAHKLFIAKQVGQWIAECEQHDFASASDEAGNIREWRRQYDRATKVPTSLVEKLEKVRAHAREAWRQARQQSKFSLFKPHLDKVLKLTRQMADCWGYQDSPYNALVEGYEPAATAAQLRQLFSELRPAITSVLGAAVAKSAAVPADLLKGEYPIAAQQAFNRKVAEAIGFDFQAGRIDTTTHPFCTTLGTGDCRLTTRYNETDFAQSLYGILHEAGHGMYEQGLVPKDYGTPNGSAASLGIHESQSRLWENHVGRGPAFWEHWHPVACEHFPGLKKFSPAQITAAVNRVSPSFIRVEADQVTYDLHIILRFEIEVNLVEGKLKTADVPAYWNEQFEKMFGLKVTKDSDGCLQDIHWSIGLFGYFATYTLGNLNAAQLMRRAATENPGLTGELARGEYKPLLSWLREKIHRQGSRHAPRELIRLATGEPTGIRDHVDYLRAKFVG